MLPRRRNSRLNRRMVSRRPRLGSLTLSFYSLTLFMLVAGGQVSVSHSAPIPGSHTTREFIPKGVHTSQTPSSFEQRLQEASSASLQRGKDVKPLAVLNRMIADLAHVKNELVLLVLVSALVLYFCALAWTESNKFKDRGKSMKQRLQHFGRQGNFKPYLITLGTGMLPGSGCQSEVLMKLTGKSGSTPYYNLPKMFSESGQLNPCRRGAQSAFVIWTRNMGDLASVEFKLDNHPVKKNPTWLLDFIRVTDCRDETQRTWLINKLQVGAGPHIFNIQSSNRSKLQACRYMAVNLLKGFSRFSVWHAWTLLKVDTSLGVTSALSICLLFTVSQMALCSALLFWLPHQMPTSNRSDTWQQALHSYGLSMSYKKTLVLLAGGTTIITACIWVIEALFRFTLEQSSGLTKKQLKQFKKAVKKTKYEEDRLNGKSDVVKKTKVKMNAKVNKQADASTTTPAAATQGGIDKTPPSDETTTIVERDKEAEGNFNSSGSGSSGPEKDAAQTVSDKELLPEEKSQMKQVKQVGNTSAKEFRETVCEQQKIMSAPRDTARDLRDMTGKEGFSLHHGGMPVSEEDSFPGKQHFKDSEDKEDDSSLSDEEKMLSDVSVKRLVGNVWQKIMNSLMEAEEIKQTTESTSLDMDKLAYMVVKAAVDAGLQIYRKKSCDDSETNRPTVENLTKMVSSDVLASSVVCKETPSIPAATNIALDACNSNRDTLQLIQKNCSVTDPASMQSKVPLESVAPDSLKVALKESIAECVATLSSTLPMLSDKLESNDIKPDEDADVDATKFRPKQEKDCMSSVENEAVQCDSNNAMKPVIGRASKDENGSDKPSTIDKHDPEDESFVHYVNEVQPPARIKKRKSIISKMGKTLRGLKKSKSKSKERVVTVNSTSPPQSCMLNIEPTAEEKEAHTDISDHNLCTVKYEREKTPKKKVLHRLKKKNKDQAACPSPSETKAIADENKEKKRMVDCNQNIESGVTAKSCTEVVAPGSGTDVKEQNEEGPAWSPGEEQPDEPVPLPSVEQQEDRTVLSQEPLSDKQILSQMPQPEENFSSTLKQQSMQHLSCEEQQKGKSFPCKDLPTDGTINEDKQVVEDQQGNLSQAVDDQKGVESPFVKAQQVHRSSDYKGQDASHGTADEEEIVVHKCDNAFFSQYNLNRIKRKIIRKMLFHLGKVVNERPKMSQYSVMHRVLVALDQASFSFSVYTSILDLVIFDLQSLQESWKSSCTCGLMYQIGCFVLRKTANMKEAIGLDEVPLDKKVLETALDVACRQEATVIVDMMSQHTESCSSLGTDTKKLIPEVDNENIVFDEPRQHKAPAAAVEMDGKLPNVHRPEKEHGAESLPARASISQPVYPKPSSASLKTIEAKSAMTISPMDDASTSHFAMITPQLTEIPSEKDIKEKRKIEAWLSACKRRVMERHQLQVHGKKKRSHKNQSCSTAEPTTDASKDPAIREMTVGEANKPDGLLKMGEMVLDQDYVDQALLTIEAEIAGTIPSFIPAFLSYIIFLLLILLCVVASVVCVLFGSVLSRHMAVMWLVYTAAGLICHIGVLEPVKVLLVVFFFSVMRQFIK